MIERDTIRLLRECDSGVKMGITAIDDVLGHVKGSEMKIFLRNSKRESESIRSEIQSLLNEYHDNGKDPNPIVQGMSWAKTNWEMIIDGTDSRIAELMIDGCNMGIKSLCKYMNKYKAADESSIALVERIIKSEEKLSSHMRRYL